MSAYRTRRPANRCSSCGHTWHPRGHNLSRRCPECGKSSVSKAGGIGILGIIFLIFVALGDKSPKPDEGRSHNNDPSAVTSGTSAQSSPKAGESDLAPGGDTGTPKLPVIA